jgi:hypothetical protein
VDLDIERGRVHPSARSGLITYSTLTLAGRQFAAEVWLRRRRAERGAGCRRYLRQRNHARRSTHRTTRSRRSPTTARATGDPDGPEPPGSPSTATIGGVS